MKIYSNDPQDYTLEDMLFEKFNDTQLKDLVADMIEYFNEDKYAIDSFREWWIEREINNHGSDEDDYIADMAWHDYQNGD